MILSDHEFKAIASGSHTSPHELLGMHRVDEGLVVRAFLPLAKGVVAEPVHDATKPVIPLRRLGETDLFEGVAEGQEEVFAYHLSITWGDGEQWRTRDPFSFLPTISEDDLYLFGRGDELRIYEKLGAHRRTIDGVEGISFAVWAPNAHRVSVVGDFNGEDARHHPMRVLGQSGVWELFVSERAGVGSHYKYQILTAEGKTMEKTDPFGFYTESDPPHRSIVWDNSRFQWSDGDWMQQREMQDLRAQPMSVYELHLGSWRKKEDGDFFTYRELAGPIVDYIQQMGFTHVELMPVSEHAFYGSWGYQVTGFYAPTSRYGTPEDFQFLINTLHRAGIGVILDWVPAHFPKEDDWALARFDGTALYEDPDPQRGEHPDWGTAVFNFGRPEVRNFLIANARFWCDVFHVDGLRIDAVASMLHLNYSREKGEWTPNIHGGNENLEASKLLRDTNYMVHSEFPGVVTIAEESTAWPGVTKDTASGGLGFTFKWDMGWMNDTLDYFQQEMNTRPTQLDQLLFASAYREQECYCLPLSHDEVVHEKRTLLGRMPGVEAEQFANLRALFGYQWLFSGKQVLFMGGEFGQRAEWNHDEALDWACLETNELAAGAQKWITDLNHFYRDEPALWAGDFTEPGFFWVDCADRDNSVLSFVRQTPDCARQALVLLNLAPASWETYRIGLPKPGHWCEVLNSDSAHYGGGDHGNGGGVDAQDLPWHNQPWSAEFALPPLSCLVFLHSC